MEKKKWKEWVYWFSLVLVLIIIYKMLDSFSAFMDGLKSAINVLMPFIFAILIAYILYIPARKMENLYKKAPIKFIQNKARGFSVLSIYIILFVIIFAVAKYVVPNITNSIKELITNIPGYFNSAINYLNNVPDNSVLARIDLSRVTEWLKSINLSNIVNSQNISGIATKGIISATNFIFNSFVALIVSIYILLERKQILEFLKSLAGAVFKTETYARVGRYFSKTNEIFYKFISSQVLDAVVVGILMSIALTIMKVKYGILLGFMIGLLNIIPYFGAIIGVIVAVLITIFTGGIGQALALAIIAIILQQIDANIINPKIVGNSLQLSPILIIFAVTVGGAYFGFLGMLLAVPIIAIIKLLVLDYIRYRKLKAIKKERKEREKARNKEQTF